MGNVRIRGVRRRRKARLVREKRLNRDESGLIGELDRLARLNRIPIFI